MLSYLTILEGGSLKKMFNEIEALIALILLSYVHCLQKLKPTCYSILSKQLSSKSAPVRIEIFSSAENIPLLDKDLHEILIDASNSCEFSSYVDKDGETRVKIERSMRMRTSASGICSDLNTK